VVGTSGVPAEVHIPYAGLHRLIRNGGDLLRPAAEVLDAPRAQPYRVAAVLLDLLSAADEPVLVAVEDACWLDLPSWEALTFAGRRVESDRVAMVLTARDGEDMDQRARRQLAYGAWLRRQRRAADSRPVLRAAAGAFDALGLPPWAERARSELRASGESLRRPADAGTTLTPQESQIARLAAEGLSNRDIAERLFLSPRTVTTHLYRIYPKLGITSRGELARAMADST
jgi:DNA-binding NarL/FixJ family response regulator